MAYRLLLISVMVALACALPLVADTPADYLPEIHSVTVTPLVLPGDKVHVVVNATDGMWPVQGVTADGVDLWTELYPGPDPWETDPFTWSGDLDADPEPGLHTVTVVASDGDGNTVTSTAEYRTTTTKGANCRFLLTPVARLLSTRYQFKVWGKARWMGGGFSVTDGSPYPVTVLSTRYEVQDGDIVEVRGTLDPVAGPPAVLKDAAYSILATGPGQMITIPDTIVGKDLIAYCTGYLPTLVPEGTSVSVTVTSTDPSKVLLSKTKTDIGTPTIALTVEGGDALVLVFFAHGLASSGSADVTVSTDSGLYRLFKVNLRPSGFVTDLDEIATNTYAQNVHIPIRAAALDPCTMRVIEYERMRAGIGDVGVSVTSSDTAVGEIMGSPVLINAATPYPAARFDPKSVGTTSISIGTPPGFSTPSEGQSITATVTTPLIYCSSTHVGRDLVKTTGCTLGEMPPLPMDVTIEVGDESVATVSLNASQAGAKSVVFEDPQTYSFQFSVQGRNVGTTTLTARADGYESRVATITVDPTGFTISESDIVASTCGHNHFHVKPARLDPQTMNVAEVGKLRAGVPTILIPAESSNPQVGVVSASPLALISTTSVVEGEFAGVAVGTCTITIGTPEGYTTPSQDQSIPAEVVTWYDILPSSGDHLVGYELVRGTNCSLSCPPPSPVDITIESADPSIATVSLNQGDPGAGVLVIPGVQTKGPQQYCVQGRSVGTTDLTITAPGYTPATRRVIVHPSGFVIFTSSFTTSAGDYDNTGVQIRPARLDPVTLRVAEWGIIRGGGSDVGVPVLSSDTLVGSIVDSPVMFAGLMQFGYADFDPEYPGVSTISIVTPEGFATPSERQSITATVTPRTFTAYNVQVGLGLVEKTSCRVNNPPAPDLNVTVEVADETVATVSLYPWEVGSKSISFLSGSGWYDKEFCIQGHLVGATTFTIQADGYAPCTRTITVVTP